MGATNSRKQEAIVLHVLVRSLDLRRCTSGDGLPELRKPTGLNPRIFLLYWTSRNNILVHLRGLPALTTRDHGHDGNGATRSRVRSERGHSEYASN